MIRQVLRKSVRRQHELVNQRIMQGIGGENAQYRHFRHIVSSNRMVPNIYSTE
jgi:hypothetical protein